MNAYLVIFVFLIIATCISLALMIIPAIIAPYSPSKEKNSQYECGINPINKKNSTFDIKFFLVALLFMVFDLEILLLLPFAANAKHSGDICFYSVMFFIALLSCGLIYEYKKKILDW